VFVYSVKWPVMEQWISTLDYVYKLSWWSYCLYRWGRSPFLTC